jgi:hypothetical protein
VFSLFILFIISQGVGEDTGKPVPNRNDEKVSFFSIPSPPSSKVAELPELLNPEGINIDNDYIYINQGVKIYIYSRKDYKLIKQVGSKGEGPGEFPDGVYVYVQPDHIVASTNDKVVYFTKDGSYIKEKKTRPAGTWLVPLDNLFAARKYTIGKDGKRYHGVMLLNSDLERIKDIYSHIHGFQGPNVPINLLTISPPEFVTCEDKLFVRTGDREKIIVFDKQGKKLFELTDKDERVKFTEQDKKEFASTIKSYQSRKSFFKFPKYFPPIRWFYIDPVKKMVYIETETEEKGKRKWLVFDFKGQLVKKIMLPILSRDMKAWNFPLHHAFYNGKNYRLVENQDEEVWELHVIEIK